MHALWADLDYPHFVTTTIRNREKLFSDDCFARIAMEELHGYAERYCVVLIAAVVMPDHMHCIIQPKGMKTFSDYVRGVKSFSAKRINEVRRGQGTPPIRKENICGTYPSSPMSDSTQPIWQDSFFDYVITTEEKLAEKIWYIIRNPVEDNLVAGGAVYPYLYVCNEFDPRV